VHHLNPISQTEGEHEVDPVNDLIPLCSNCHSMIHRLEDPGDWQKLKEMFETENE
jgi:predicted HNH restriction endonuclease